jgi:hypothetical protein
MSVKEQLIRRLEEMPESRAEHLLQYLDDLENDPVYRAFMEAPEEPPLEDELQAIRETDEEIARCEGIPLEEVARRLQITLPEVK